MKAEVEDNRLEISSTVDVRGLFCPLPVVKLRRELDKLRLNEVVKLLADDPGVLDDIPSWCKETRNTLLSLHKDRRGIFIAYVKKTSGDEE